MTWQEYRRQAQLALPAKHRVWTGGNEAAAQFLDTVARIIRVADDIADGDAKGPEAVSTLLMAALVQLPTNAFYRQHATWFAPVFSAVILAWGDSDRLAGIPQREALAYGYVTRAQCRDIYFQTALICGGLDHARKVMVDFHQHCHGEPEPLLEFEREHRGWELAEPDDVMVLVPPQPVPEVKERIDAMLRQIPNGDDPERAWLAVRERWTAMFVTPEMDAVMVLQRKDDAVHVLGYYSAEGRMETMVAFLHKMAARMGGKRIRFETHRPGFARFLGAKVVGQIVEMEVKTDG